MDFSIRAGIDVAIVRAIQNHVITLNQRGRISDLRDFYSLLDALACVCSPRSLSTATGRMDWPLRGVYFFTESGESRSDSGTGPRVVRVGTHALKENSRTTLWNRLSQHRGSRSSTGGNHRGSIFRLIVGAALQKRDRLDYSTWGVGSSAPKDTVIAERPLEQRVSAIIGSMPFYFLSIPDPAGPESLRGYIERNAIALLSNFGRNALDPAGSGWLGHHCDRAKVRESGLWNSNHVDEFHDGKFLTTLERAIIAMKHAP